MINWKVRIKSKTFWVAIIPALLLLARQILAVFGVNFDITAIQSQLLAIIETVFAILAIMGITIDHTTAGIADSQRAMTYKEPYKEIEE